MATLPALGAGGCRPRLAALLATATAALVISDVTPDGSIANATIWHRTGPPHGLGLFPGGNFSFALAANDHGDYTGLADSSEITHVFLAEGNGPLETLPPLSGNWSTNPSRGLGIDNRGDIVGDSQSASGATHAVLWPRALRHAFIPPVAATRLHHQAAPNPTSVDLP